MDRSSECHIPATRLVSKPRAPRPRSSNLRRFRDDPKTARDVACRKLRRAAYARPLLNSLSRGNDNTVGCDSIWKRVVPGVRGPFVVTFYRGVWRPFCNLDLQALEEARPALAARGPSLVAISPQTPANSRKAQRQLNLGFPMLSDAGGSVAAACAGPSATICARRRESLGGPDAVQWRGQLDPAHAGPLRDRPGPDNRLRRGQS